MKIVRRVQIAGRGDILLIEAEDGLVLPRLDDLIYFERRLWLVTGIEYQKLLTDPVQFSPNIGLRVIAHKGRA